MNLKAAHYEHIYNNLQRPKKGLYRYLTLIRLYLACLFFDKNFILKTDYTIIGNDILLSLITAIQLAKNGHRCIIITESIPECDSINILKRRYFFYGPKIMKWLKNEIPHANAASNLQSQICEIAKSTVPLVDCSGSPLISLLREAPVNFIPIESESKSIGMIQYKEQPKKSDEIDHARYMDKINFRKDGNIYLESKHIVLTSRTTEKLPLCYTCPIIYLGDAAKPLEGFEKYIIDDRIQDLEDAKSILSYNISTPPLNKYNRRYYRG